MVDEVASYLNYFDLLVVRQTSKTLYAALGGTNALRQSLIALEEYWASKEHQEAITSRLYRPKPEFYPSYLKYLRHAPCYTCLRITKPQNTVHSLVFDNEVNLNLDGSDLDVNVDPAGSNLDNFSFDAMTVDPSESFMLESSFFAVPYDSDSDFDSRSHKLLFEPNLARKCIACTIQAAKDDGQPQKWHRTALKGDQHKFHCTSCATTKLTEGVCDRDLQFNRFEHSRLCLECFEAANAGWLTLKERLTQQNFELTTWTSLSVAIHMHTVSETDPMPFPSRVFATDDDPDEQIRTRWENSTPGALLKTLNKVSTSVELSLQWMQQIDGLFYIPDAQRKAIQAVIKARQKQMWF